MSPGYLSGRHCVRLGLTVRRRWLIDAIVTRWPMRTRRSSNTSTTVSFPALRSCWTLDRLTPSSRAASVTETPVNRSRSAALVQLCTRAVHRLTSTLGAILTAQSRGDHPAAPSEASPASETPRKRLQTLFNYAKRTASSLSSRMPREARCERQCGGRLSPHSQSRYPTQRHNVHTI